MKILKARILWATYIIIAALFFFYALFPSEAVKEYLADRIRQVHPNLTVKMGRVRPVFPPALKLDNIRVDHLGRNVAAFEDLKITPDILSLFSATTHLTFNGQGYGGILRGAVDIIKKSAQSDVMVDADISGMQLSRVAALGALTTHKISGNLNATLTYKGNAQNPMLAGDVTLTNGQIEFSPPVLEQNTITFDSIEAQMSYDGRSLTIKHCRLKGNQLDADVSGSIKFSRGSTLDLTGTVRPHERLLAQLGQNGPRVFEGSNWAKQGLPFRISGSLDSPNYSLF
jgi:type II secretion system protein N